MSTTQLVMSQSPTRQALRLTGASFGGQIVERLTLPVHTKAPWLAELTGVVCSHHSRSEPLVLSLLSTQM